jgi:hypothetical protein
VKRRPWGSESPSEGVVKGSSMSVDLTITYRGRRVLWLERVLGVVVLPYLRWRARRGE